MAAKKLLVDGQQVLVYGASGANGICAVQLANHLGAELTGVCSTANVELMRSLGADAILDYTKGLASAFRRYDFVFDAVGQKNIADESTFEERVNACGQIHFRGR